MKKGRGARDKGQILALGLWLCVVFAIVTFAQGQPPPAPPDGFVPASSLPAQEQLPAAPLVVAAYSIVWLLVCGYLWSIWQRIQRAQRDLAEVRRRVPATGDRR